MRPEQRPENAPEYEPVPETAAGPPRNPLPVRPRPPDGPVPRESGGGPSLTDQDPDEDSALGPAHFREDTE